jgi:hypothetical protein
VNGARIVIDQTHGSSPVLHQWLALDSTAAAMCLFGSRLFGSCLSLTGWIFLLERVSRIRRSAL